MGKETIILKPMKTTVYTHPSGLSHDTGPTHAESIARLETILALLKEEPFSQLPIIDAIAATEEQILRAHHFNYFEKVLETLPDQGHVNIDSDTVLSPGSWKAALHAAGAVCQAVDDIAAGKTTRAFCAMRPPGHHAEPHQSMGFCLFNNIFIGARQAQEIHGVEKIAIVDFDVHHGNGTDYMTRRHDGSILFISTHQSPLWPMTGLEDDNDDTVMNFTLAPETGSAECRALYEKKVFPELEDFAPDLLMISAGFDAHKADPLAQLNWEVDDYAWLTKKLSDIADKYCDGKIVSVLEGGYNLDALSTCLAAHLKGLAKI
jgi:acetoin utilization deacetylase AcuC-like enzyme